MSKLTREFVIDVRIDIFKSPGYRTLDIHQVLRVINKLQSLFGGNHGYYDKLLYNSLGLKHGLIYDIIDENGHKSTISVDNFNDFMCVEGYYVPENFIWFYENHDYIIFNKKEDYNYAKMMLKLIL